MNSNPYEAVRILAGGLMMLELVGTALWIPVLFAGGPTLWRRRISPPVRPAQALDLVQLPRALEIERVGTGWLLRTGFVGFPFAFPLLRGTLMEEGDRLHLRVHVHWWTLLLPLWIVVMRVDAFGGEGLGALLWLAPLFLVPMLVQLRHYRRLWSHFESQAGPETRDVPG